LLLIVILPFPGLRKTRATEVFRRPVAANTFSAIIVLLCYDCQGFRLLRFMWMFWTRIYLKLGHQFATQTVLRQHSLYRKFHELLWFFFQHFRGSSLPDAAGIFGVPIINFLLQFRARELDAARINDDDEVSRVLVRRKNRFILSPQDFGDFSG